MAELELSKSCDECKGNCIPLPCSTRPESSEFYCSKCHKSYRMSVESAKYMLAMEIRARGNK